MSGVAGVLAPIVIGLAYVVVCSFVPEPARRKLNVVMTAGLGAAYISGGSLGLWELAFTTVMTVCAYLGFRDYRWLGVAWLLHTGWDVVHHLRGAPIIPELQHSSYGCAICDPVVAVWFLLGAPSVVPRAARARLVTAAAPAAEPPVSTDGGRRPG